MKKELVERFWKDFTIATQEESLDVAFANPADVARALIKARNWSATLTQELVKVLRRLGELTRDENEYLRKISEIEREILTREHKAGSIPSSATKNKDIQNAFIRSKAIPEERELLKSFEISLVEVQGKLHAGNLYKEQVETLRKTLEKTTDWLVQYINWHKFELRELV